LHAQIGIAPEIVNQNNYLTREWLRIQIENKEGGSILISPDAGKTWESLGAVLKPATQTNPQGYTASRWAQISKVSATAVNAIHIKTDQNLETGKGIVMSILPKEFSNADSGIGRGYNKSYFDSPSSIQTDIPAGTKIFGGGFSPIVGNPVYQIRGSRRSLISQGYQPTAGDVLEIQVLVPDPYPLEIVFENQFGGLITITYPNAQPVPIGQVLKPVYGIGRFAGTKYAGLGRIRANHSGVIDISTSTLGEDTVGGFQIIPKFHGQSPELEKARMGTQWMIVAPLDARSPSFEGFAPLFSSYIMPSFTESESSDTDWKRQYMYRTLVQVRENGGSWKSMPAYSMREGENLPEDSKTFLRNVSHFRILFPILTRETKTPELPKPKVNRTNQGTPKFSVEMTPIP
jgi:hypothetical protein